MGSFRLRDPQNRYIRQRYFSADIKSADRSAYNRKGPHSFLPGAPQVPLVSAGRETPRWPGCAVMAIELLVFEINGRHVAVPTTCVREVIRAVALFPLPESSSLVRGGLDLRGEVVPVLDGRVLMGDESRTMQPADHLIVLKIDDRSLALHVDRAREITTLSGADWHRQKSAPPFRGMIKSERHPIAVLDPESLLAEIPESSLPANFARGSTS